MEVLCVHRSVQLLLRVFDADSYRLYSFMGQAQHPRMDDSLLCRIRVLSISLPNHFLCPWSVFEGR